MKKCLPVTSWKHYPLRIEYVLGERSTARKFMSSEWCEKHRGSCTWLIPLDTHCLIPLYVFLFGLFSGFLMCCTYTYAPGEKKYKKTKITQKACKCLNYSVDQRFKTFLSPSTQVTFLLTQPRQKSHY